MRTFIIALTAFVFIASTAFAESYTCPMHPHYISDNEDGSCPICGMNLVPMTSNEPEEMSSIETSKHKDHDAPSKDGIKISPETIQNMGVRTQKAKMAHFGTNVRSYGLVGENVRAKQEISSRIDGWIEELYITAIGDKVKKGDLLFRMYSPELLSAQQDYLAAIATGTKGRMISSAKRLKSLGVQEKFIQQLKSSHKSQEKVPFYADTNGIISELYANSGSYIKPGMEIATLQDYSSVWINASVAEKDLQFLSINNKATIIFPNLGGVERIAYIDYIHPTIDASTRTGKVRLVLNNDKGNLKPGAYADIIFETNVDNRLAIPSEAILKKSDGNFVIVALGEGRFKPQKVVTGINSSRGMTEIISGIHKGDNIVISSQFLIDSESSFRESFNKLTKPNKTKKATAKGHRHAH
jgi:Cu(I)/Ag(I) efflux system membrane fusion protein